MGVLCLTCRTLGRQLFLKRGVLLLTSILLVLVMLGVYSFMQYSAALQEAASSNSIVRDVEEPSEIPIFVKKNDSPKPVDSLKPVENNSLPQPASIRTVEVSVPQVKQLANDDETFLQLTGSEDECVFSATTPEHKPTVNVLDLFDELAFDNPDGGVWKQGYDIKYDVGSFKEEPLQVFVAPHSHNDPGWIKTFQDYYSQQTRHILDSVVNALAEDERRRFIWAEISFFDLWWNEQSADRKELTKKLIKNGQLEMVTGGWVMNDEANTHYFAMIDQLMEGHQWLHDNVGVKPISGWAIDPFGYTPTMAYLLQRMGFHNMLIQRIHYALKKHFSKKKQLEFLWRQSWDHSTSTDMLCHMMPFYSYDVPHTCGPDPKICCQFDFLRLPGHRVTCPWRVPAQVITGSNVQERATMLLDQYRKKAQLYRTNVLLVPLGDDFRYDSSSETHDQYNNYQRIFSYFDSHPELNVKAQFGTLRDYFTALRKSTGVSGSTHPPGYPTLTGDFFTYCDREHDYWSGYYTSRPFYKNLDRILEDRLRAAEIIYTLAKAESLPLADGLDTLLTKARRNLGLFQHHDGITGTAKNHVVVDYGARLLDGVNGADRVMAASAQALLLGKSQTQSTTSEMIFDVSETRAQHDALPEKKVIKLAENEKRVVCLYNSLTHSRQELVSLVVSTASVSIYDADDNPIASQVNPVMSSNNIDSTKYEVVFMVKLAPLSVTKYHIAGVANQLTMMATVECSSGAPSNSLFKTSSITSQSPFTLSTERLEVSFDGSTGLLQSVRAHGSSNREVKTVLDFTVYSSRASGAYLFLPNGGAESIVHKSSLPFCVIKGPMLHRVQVTMEMITHTAQISNSPGVDGQSVYISNIVDVRKESNKELIMKISTTVNNNNRVYYTDLNGFQTVQRKTLDKLTTQGNFYPMPSYMFLQDTTSRVTLLSGQPLGVSSQETGVFEVVLDRRLSMDDNRGLGHGVMDNKVTLSSFRLLVEHRSSADSNPTRQVAYPSLMAHYTSSILTLPIHPFIMKTSSIHQLAASYTGLKGQLPCDIHMLNLRSVVTSSSKEAAMLLHRKGFDCGFSAALLTCHLSSGQVSARTMFTKEPSSSQRMSLTMMYPSDAAPDHIDPMEIATHKLSWS